MGEPPMTDLLRPGKRGTLIGLAVAAASFALVMASGRTAPEPVTQRSGSEASSAPTDQPEKPGPQAASGREQRGKDIRLLSQHFNEPGKDLSPWMFVPKENINQLSPTAHPTHAPLS